MPDEPATTDRMQQIEVDPEVYRALEAEAKRTGVGMNLVLRRSLGLVDSSHGGHG